MLIAGIVIGIVIMLALTPSGGTSYFRPTSSRWPDVPPPPGYCKHRYAPDLQGDNIQPRDD